MKTATLFLGIFLSLATALSAKTFPPVLLSADLENRGHGGDTENKAPQHYALYIAPYEEFGNVAAGGVRPPSAETIARLVQAALPADQYVLVANKSEEPDVIIGVQWGEISPRGPQPFVSAREGGVIRPIWAIGVGRTHVPPFILESDRSSLADELSRDRFYLLISSYDPAALRNGKVSIHWQTRTSIDSLQASGTEAWGYLAGVAKDNVAKLIDRPKFVSDAVSIAPGTDNTPIIPIDEVIPGASKLMTFVKATPPY